MIAICAVCRYCSLGTIMMRMMTMKMGKETNILDTIQSVMVNDMMPKVKEIISQQVAQGIEEAFNRKVSRMESIEKYLQLLYESQRSGHAVHDEIDKALKQFKEEAGI